MGNFKSSATAQQLLESLALRTGLAVVVDESGADPIVSVGAVAATTNVGVQIGVYDQRGGDAAGWKSLPGFGSVDQPVYTGTVFKVAYEVGAAPGAFYFGFGNLFQVVGDLVRRGATVELWEIANGNAPTIANIAGNGTLVGTFNGNLNWPLQGRA